MPPVNHPKPKCSAGIPIMNVVGVRTHRAVCEMHTGNDSAIQCLSTFQHRISPLSRWRPQHKSLTLNRVIPMSNTIANKSRNSDTRCKVKGKGTMVYNGTGWKCMVHKKYNWFVAAQRSWVLDYPTRGDTAASTWGVWVFQCLQSVTQTSRELVTKECTSGGQ